MIEPWKVVQQMRDVPSFISKPCYYKSWSKEIPPPIIEIKNNDQIESMRQSCMLAKKVLNHTATLIKVGRLLILFTIY